MLSYFDICAHKFIVNRIGRKKYNLLLTVK